MFGISNIFWGSNNEDYNNQNDEMLAEEEALLAGAGHQEDVEEDEDVGGEGEDTETRTKGVSLGAIVGAVGGYVARKVTNTAFSAITYTVLKTKKSESSDKKEKEGLSKHEKAEGFDQFLTLLTDKLAGLDTLSKMLGDTVKGSAAAYLGSALGSVAGNATTLALMENKEFISSLLKSILGGAFENLLVEAKKAAVRKSMAEGRGGAIENIDMLSLLSFFMTKVNAELDDVRAGKQSLDQATDKLLKILFPNQAEDLHIAEGYVNRAIGLKNLVWSGLRSAFKDALESKLKIDMAQAAYMKDIPHEEKAPAEKMAKEVVDLVFAQGPETYAGLVFPLLKLDPKAGLQGKDKELADALNHEVGNAFSSKRSESKELREGLVAFLAPVMHHLQQNNIRGIPPEQYTLAELVDDALGVIVDTHDVACSHTNTGKYHDVTEKMERLLHIQGKNELPLGAEITKSIRNGIKENLPGLLKDSSHIGKSSEAKRKECIEKLEANVGKEAADKYVALVGVLGEQIVPAVVGQITSIEQRKEFVGGSHMKKLVENILLQVLVNAMENSRAGGHETAGMEDVVNNLGTQLSTFMKADGDKIDKIIHRPPNPKLTPEQDFEQKRAELAKEFSGLSKSIFTTIGAKPGAGVQAPLDIPFNKVLIDAKPGEKSLWENISAVIVPDQLAKAVLDMGIHVTDTEKNKATLDGVQNYRYKVDADGNYVMVKGKRVRESEGEGVGTVLERINENVTANIIEMVEKICQDEGQIGGIFDAIVGIIEGSESPEAKKIAEFLKDPATRADAKVALTGFLKTNPGFLKILKPIIEQYLGSIVMHAARSPILESQKIAKGAEVAGKKVAGNPLLFANVGFQLMENINDHFQFIIDARDVSGKKWAHEVSYEEYMKLLKEGVPQTREMVEARKAIDAAVAKKRALRREFFSPATSAARKDKIDAELKVQFEIISKNKNVVRAGEKGYLDAVKKGKKEEYVNKLKAENRLADVPPRTIISDKMPQSEKALEARKEIKVEEAKLKEQRIKLKKAKKQEDKDACVAAMKESIQKIAGFKQIIEDERTMLLRPFIEKVLNLVDLGKEEEIPLPEALRSKVIDIAKNEGARAAAKFLGNALSRSSINEALTSAFEGYNESFYKTSAEKAEEARLGGENLGKYQEEQKKAKGERNVFGRAADSLGRIHTSYFGEGGEKPVEEEGRGADQDLKDVCGGAIHKLSRLVPNSILKTAFGFKMIEDIGGDVVANLLHKPLTEDLKMGEVVDDIISGVDDSMKPKKDVPGLPPNDAANVGELNDFIKLQLRELEREEELQKQMLKAGTETATHIYMVVIMASIKSIGSAIDNAIDTALGRASPIVRGFFRAVYIAALFDGFCKVLSWLAVPPIMALEAMIKFYLSFRAQSVSELAHLDVHENLADTILDTIVNELQHSIDEINEEAQVIASPAGSPVTVSIEGGDFSEVGSNKDSSSNVGEDEDEWMKVDGNEGI